jgi:hypothetical protein
MKPTYKKIISSVSKSTTMPFRFFAYALTGVLVLSSCSRGTFDTQPKTPSEALDCKKKPSQPIYGTYRFNIKYNAKGQPVELATYTQNTTPNSDPGVKTTYTITYNEQGKPNKVSKVIGDKSDANYVLEYNNSKGTLSKQSAYDVTGKLLSYSLTEYDVNGLLTKMTTHTEGNEVEITNTYEYANGNLIKKTTQNLYDVDSKEYYTADYTYGYEDKALKAMPLLEGPLGQRIIADLANSVSLEFQSRDYYHIFFQVNETSANKNILKNIQIIAQRYKTRDTTSIDYNYEYDADGFPTFEKGALKNTTRRTFNTSLGVPATVTTPHSNSFNYTIDYNCK